MEFQNHFAPIECLQFQIYQLSFPFVRGKKSKRNESKKFRLYFAAGAAELISDTQPELPQLRVCFSGPHGTYLLLCSNDSCNLFLFRF